MFDRGDLFSVGLYMVIWLFSAWLMGPVQCDRSQQKNKKGGVGERKGCGQGFGGQRSLEASVIRIIAIFLVLVEASPIWLCGHISD